MADAVDALGQHVEQEAADELACFQCHGAIALPPIATIILVSEGHAGLVERDQAAVGDGDAVCVARQVGEHGLRPGEGRLGVDERALLAERRQDGGKGLLIAEAEMIAEEAQTAGGMERGKLIDEEPPEQL